MNLRQWTSNSTILNEQARCDGVNAENQSFRTSLERLNGYTVTFINKAMRRNQ